MFFCEAHPFFVLYDGDTSLFGVSQFFDSLTRHLGVVIFQVVFNSNTLLFDLFLFRFFHDVSDRSVHLFVSFSPFSVTHLFLQFSSLVAQIEDVSVTHCFFMRRCLPRISLVVSVTAMFIAVIIVSISLFSFSSRMSGANFPPIFAWKDFATKCSLFLC